MNTFTLLACFSLYCLFVSQVESVCTSIPTGDNGGFCFSDGSCNLGLVCNSATNMCQCPSGL